MRRPWPLALLVGLLVGFVSLISVASSAPLARLGHEPSNLIERVQVGPGGAINPGRDCQTIRRCNFTAGGSYRGCISAYSCRTCVPVAARCTISGRERVCREFQCSWGG